LMQARVHPRHERATKIAVKIGDQTHPTPPLKYVDIWDLFFSNRILPGVIAGFIWEFLLRRDSC